VASAFVFHAYLMKISTCQFKAPRNRCTSLAVKSEPLLPTLQTVRIEKIIRKYTAYIHQLSTVPLFPFFFTNNLEAFTHGLPMHGMRRNDDAMENESRYQRKLKAHSHKLQRLSVICHYSPHPASYIVHPSFIIH
jgi:hypothetical protein